MSSIARALASLQEEIESACRRAGRDRAELTLVAVSKGFPSAAVRAAHNAGIRHVGENRVQEILRKRPELEDLDLTWHMVGHLQTNKISTLLPQVDLLHSLDRIPLAEALSKKANPSTPLSVLFQVNTSGEPTKFGVSPPDLAALVDHVRTLPSLRPRGFMCIGPLAGSEDEVRRAFALLRRLREETVRRHPDLALPELSMGMSEDFPLAILEGATLLRIGTRIFGARPTPGKVA